MQVKAKTRLEANNWQKDIAYIDNAKQRLLAGANEGQMLTYLKRHNVGGPYLAVWKELKSWMGSRLEPFTLAITLMSNGTDEDDALKQVNLGPNHASLASKIKEALARAGRSV